MPEPLPDSSRSSTPQPSRLAGAMHSPRLMSLDALRGFDMFWIVGAEEIVHALHKSNASPLVSFLTAQLTHKDWEGVAFYDLIFPLFIFIIGVSLVFSLEKIRAQEGTGAACRRVLTRGVLLYLLGIFYYGGFADGTEQIRLMGVLQRLGLCYLAAGLLFCVFQLRGLIVCCVSLLVGYWAVMCFVPIPGVGAGNFAEGMNLANYIDKQFLPLRKWDGNHDPEGLLSTLPAVATCLLGVFAGMLLKNQAVPGQKKVLLLAGAGVAGVAAGFLWGLQFPVIKKIWTSSYVLVAGGYSCLFLAAFYQIIDVWKIQTWALPFVWIGMNPLTIYLVHNIVDLNRLANRLVGGPIKGALGNQAEVLVAATVLAFTFGIVYLLHRRKIFLRL